MSHSDRSPTLASSFRYAPGSICSLRPETSSEEVDTFLKLNKLEDEADRPMVIDICNTGRFPFRPSVIRPV